MAIKTFHNPAAGTLWESTGSGSYTYVKPYKMQPPALIPDLTGDIMCCGGVILLAGLFVGLWLGQKIQRPRWYGDPS